MPTTELIGISESFRTFLDNVNLVAPVDSTVLIQGETGTGKELAARAIHETSRRRGNAFIAVNCAAIPSSLLESELFGVERGAFTGAIQQTIGRFQAADRGTLFLDEIGELPLELQPKLLRALQEKQVQRLGSARTLQVDVRVVAATNQDLWHMVQERKFRADLYYRLNVFPILLPPLRERREDIRPLTEYFLAKFSKQQGKSIDEIPDELMTLLAEYDWPGNIRELQNVVERGVIVTSGSSLSWKTIESLRTTRSAPTNITAIETSAIETLAGAQRAHIVRVLRETKGVVAGPNGAAVRLGMKRTTLMSRMERLGIGVERGVVRTLPAQWGAGHAVAAVG